MCRSVDSVVRACPFIPIDFKLCIYYGTAYHSSSAEDVWLWHWLHLSLSSKSIKNNNILSLSEPHRTRTCSSILHVTQYIHMNIVITLYLFSGPGARILLSLNRKITPNSFLRRQPRTLALEYISVAVARKTHYFCTSTWI